MPPHTYGAREGTNQKPIYFSCWVGQSVFMSIATTNDTIIYSVPFLLEWPLMNDFIQFWQYKQSELNIHPRLGINRSAAEAGLFL